MQVFLIDLKNRTILIDISPHATIKTLHQMISNKLGIPANLFYLTYNAKFVPNDIELHKLNINHSSVVRMAFGNQFSEIANARRQRNKRKHTSAGHQEMQSPVNCS